MILKHVFDLDKGGTYSIRLNQLTSISTTGYPQCKYKFKSILYICIYIYVICFIDDVYSNGHMNGNSRSPKRVLTSTCLLIRKSKADVYGAT